MRKDKSCITISASILGSNQTGKTALLQRLQGENPFKNSGSYSGVQKDQNSTNASISWNNGKFDALVHLHDGEIAADLDVAFILIDPRNRDMLSDAEIIAHGVVNNAQKLKHKKFNEQVI